jgi:ShK domain-like
MVPHSLSLGGLRPRLGDDDSECGGIQVILAKRRQCCATPQQQQQQQQQPPTTACRRQRITVGPPATAVPLLVVVILAWVVEMSLVSADSSHQKQRWTRRDLLEQQHAFTTFSYEFIEDDDDDFDYDTFDIKAAAMHTTCRDVRPSCADWAAAGDSCTADAAYMHPHCPVSCNVCHERVLVQSTRMVRHHAGPVHALEDISSFGIYNIDARTLVYDAIRSHNVSHSHTLVPQRMVAGHEDDIRAGVAETVMYLMDEVYQEDRYQLVRSTCRATHAECAYRAAVLDDCENETTMDWMLEHCAAACLACDLLHVEARCPIDPNEKHGTCV